MKLFRISVGLLLTLLTAISPNAQKLYTWTDANGVMHIADQPPPERDTVQDVEVIRYEEKTPQEIQAIQHKKENLRRQLDREERIEKARQAEMQAVDAEKKAQEAVQKAREEFEYNNEYIRRLNFTKNSRRKHRKRVDRIKVETEAFQAEAKAAIKQAEEAARKARIAAEEAQKGTQE